MPLFRKPTFHDRSAIMVEGPITTTSSTFVDIPGATITTGDLGEPAVYDFWINFELTHSNNNSSVSFRVTIDGIPGPVRTIARGPNTSNDPSIVSLANQSPPIGSSVAFQIQWSTPSGTATINDLTLSFDGIADSRII